MVSSLSAYFPSLSGHKSTIKQTASNEPSVLFAASAPGASASCCIAPMLGDMGKAMDGSRVLAGPTMNQSACNPITFLTGYIAGGATIASLKTAISTHKQEKIIQEALSGIEKIFPEPNRMEEFKTTFAAFEKYLRTTLNDVSFVKIVPGIMSGIASALIGFGMFLPPFVSIAGLAVGVTDGCLHIIKTIELIQRYRQQINDIKLDNDLTPDQKERMIKSLEEEKLLCKKRCMGAVFTVIGVTALVFAYLSMNQFIMITELAMMVAMLAGIICLVPAIYLSIRYNPYQDLFLKKKFLEEIKNTFTDQEKLIHNLNLSKKELISKIEIICKEQNSSLHYNSILNKQNIITKKVNEIKLAAPQILNYATFNLIPILNTLNRKSKENVADSFYNIFTWADRREFLKNYHEQNKEFNYAAETEEEKFREELRNNGKVLGKVLQLIAMQALDKKGSSFVSPYKELFDKSTNRQDILLILNNYRDTASCCNVHELFEILDDFLIIEDAIEETNNEKLKEYFWKNLVNRFDQYAVFSAKILSESDLRVYGRMFAAYYPPKNTPKNSEKKKGIRAESLALNS